MQHSKSAERKPWCWEIAQSGHGPDWHFVATVSPASAHRLAQLASTASLQGYAPIPTSAKRCDVHQQMCMTYVFIDAPNREAYTNNLRGRQPSSIWVYNLIEIHNDQLRIECGYGGRGEPYSLTETRFLSAIFADPMITLASWSVIAGGDSYTYRDIQSGTDLGSFSAYLM
jgi:hypothetical protein